MNTHNHLNANAATYSTANPSEAVVCEGYSKMTKKKKPRMPCVTVDVARERTLTVQWPWVSSIPSFRHIFIFNKNIHYYFLLQIFIEN